MVGYRCVVCCDQYTHCHIQQLGTSVWLCCDQSAHCHIQQLGTSVWACCDQSTHCHIRQLGTSVCGMLWPVCTLPHLTVGYQCVWHVVTSLHIATSDSWVPVCVVCCHQSAYCNIWQLGTSVWRAVTSLHIATSDSWVPVCGMLSPVCILPHPTVGHECVACCDQSACCNIRQLGTSVWCVVTSLHIATSDSWVPVCGVLWPVYTLPHPTVGYQCVWRVVTSLHIATSDSWVPMCGMLSPVCMLPHPKFGYQCVACCHQCAYCNIQQLGTSVWRVVSSLHIATSDSWLPVCDVLWPVCILQHPTVGYQCVACCYQSAYCHIRQLGTSVWRVVTSLHIATYDSWVPVCCVLLPVCILPHLTVGHQCVTCCDQSAYCHIRRLGTSVWRVVTSLHIATSDSWAPVCDVLWPVYTLRHPTVRYQCVTCCDQSTYCDIRQLGTSVWRVVTSLHIATSDKSAMAKKCTIFFKNQSTASYLHVCQILW